jgi:DNA-binding CsgD family transcriptional regulator
MQKILLMFYILFFATGFMGGAALLLLGIRIRSRILPPLLTLQSLFIVGMGLIAVYYYLEDLPGGLSPAVSHTILFLLMGINAAVYGIVVLLIRRTRPQSSLREALPFAARLFAGLVVAKSIANMVVIAASGSGNEAAQALGGTTAWNLGGHVLTVFAMATFGFTIRGALNPQEPPTLRPLIRAYGLCAIAFAPIGMIEYAVQSAGLAGLPSISLDHFFYLAWNLVSMSAAVRLIRPGGEATPLLQSIPHERARALGLSAREAEMALMIARGLANKEIAAELGISPATVRTHIYNLYRKTNARSRVELLNRLAE